MPVIAIFRFLGVHGATAHAASDPEGITPRVGRDVGAGIGSREGSFWTWPVLVAACQDLCPLGLLTRLLFYYYFQPALGAA